MGEDFNWGSFGLGLASVAGAITVAAINKSGAAPAQNRVAPAYVPPNSQSSQMTKYLIIGAIAFVGIFAVLEVTKG